MPLLTNPSNRVRLLVAALILLIVSFAQGSSEKGAELWFTGNYQGAVTIWKEAAANGERSAQYNLGWAFENGLGVIQDLEQSLYWYRLAASKGDRYAQLKLIQIWSDYGLASVDFAEIEQYSSEILAAKQGDFMAYLEDEAVQDKAYAKYLLSMFALASSGSREKVNSAIERLISASGQGHVLAQFALAEWYLGSDSGEPAIDEALVWLKKAAEQGYRKAQFELARIYERGGYHGQDAREALRWYREAENLGEIRARIKIGRLLKANASNPAEFEEAREWFIKAEKAGENLAKFFIGEMYFLGEGVTEDPGLGFAWVKRMISLEPSLFGVIQEFAEKGSLFAQINLAKFFSSDETGFKDLDQAFNWYLTAALQENALAAREVGLLYLDGVGVQRDIDEAKVWLERASDDGDVQAKAALVKLEVARKRLAGEKKEAEKKAEKERAIAEEKEKIEEEKVAAERKKEECEVAGGDTEALERHSSGTGFIVNQDGNLVTNAHVITTEEDDDTWQYCSAFSVHQNGEHHWARFIASDINNDLAVLKTCETTELFARLRSSQLPVQPGEGVFAYGFPLRDMLSKQPKITDGIISALGGPRNDSTLFQHSAAIQPGSSGGPLLDKYGLVVGVNNAGISWALEDREIVPQNVAFAIKSKIVDSFLQSNNIPFDSLSPSIKLEPVEIARRANRFTVLVVCWTEAEK